MFKGIYKRDHSGAEGQESDISGEPVTFEGGSQPGMVEEKASVDPDATWLKKGKKSYFGYRSYVIVDETNGYVKGVYTAPAHESEMTHFVKAI